MSPSAEQLCGITGSKKHRGVKWSDREHQSNFLSKIIHFFKKFQSFRLIMLFFFFNFLSLTPSSPTLCFEDNVPALLADGLVPACSSLYISEAASGGSFPIPDTGRLLQSKVIFMLLCALSVMGTQRFFPWKDSAVTKNLCYEPLWFESLVLISSNLSSCETDNSDCLASTHFLSLPLPFPLCFICGCQKALQTWQSLKVRWQGKRDLTTQYFYNLKIHFVTTSCHQHQLFHQKLVLQVDTGVKV